MKTVEFFEQFSDRADLLAYTDALGVRRQAVRTWIAENMPKEKIFQTKIIEALKKWREGGRLPRLFFWKQSAAPVMRGGIPDILCVIDGRLFAFEVKRPLGFGEVSAIQCKTMEAIRSAGGVAEVVSFAGEVEEILKKEGVLK